MYQLLLNPLLLAFIICLFLTPLTILLAKKLKLVDDPKKRKHPAVIHKKPIPRAGGLPIFLSIILAYLFFLPQDKLFFSILIAGTLIVTVGILDDKYDLSPYVRLIANFISAAIVVFAGTTIPYITNPLGGGVLFFKDLTLAFPGLNFEISLAAIFAAVWIVWIMNMLNWSKGIDGQMPGIVAISAFVIGAASLRFPVLTQENISAAQLSFIVAGASLGFLIFNFYPAKIFPGYSATILGFMIGVLSILSGVKLATAILVMGVPAADAGFTIIRRLITKKSPFWHDKGHLHHLLLKLGFGQRGIAVFYWTMSIILGLFALNLSSRGKLFAIILIIVLVGAFILTLKYMTRKTIND